jgi:hypothetical protein
MLATNTPFGYKLFYCYHKQDGAVARKKILVQWIGHSDLHALAANSSQARSEKLLAFLKAKTAKSEGSNSVDAVP